MAIKDLIVKGTMYAWRKMYIKRLQTDGNYEADWYEITDDVVQWGTINKSFGDNIFLGDYQIANISVALNNSNRKYSSHTVSESLWNGFKTRYRTKFKIEAGLYDENNTEVSGITFYGILFAEPITSDDNLMTFDLASILKVLQLYPAYGISLTSGTTAQLVERFVKKEVNSVRLFDRFFEGANDAERYQINSSGAYTITNPSVTQDQTIWDKIKDYSLYQNNFAYVNSAGNFIWTNRDEGTTPSWYFNGAGNFYDNDYGVNIVSVNKEVDGVLNAWTRVVIQYQDNPSALYYASEANWTPGDGSVQDIYGDRTFNYSALELSLTEATTIGDNLRAETQNPKRRWNITTTFIPHLELKDKVIINYIGESLILSPFRLDVSLLASSRVDDTNIYDPLTGYSGSISLNNTAAKIIGMNINLDDFTCEFDLMEI